MNDEYQKLDIGSSQPTSVPMETIHVEITSDNLLGSFAKAFVQEAFRVHPLRAEQVNLTEDEMKSYCEYLLYQRILTVKQECRDFRKLKSLWIPAWIQYNLSMVGEVIVYDYGFRILPEFQPSNPLITFEQAMEISRKIGAFEGQLQIVKDAMPRSINGDKDVMTTALIAGYVRSMHKVEHVSSTYVTRFLGMKIKEEAAMKTIYRIQYDDADFIAAALIHQRGLY